MPILVSCACGKRYSVKDDLVNTRIKCSGCQAVMHVGAVNAPATSVLPSKLAKTGEIEDAPVAGKIASKAAPVEEDTFGDAPRTGGKKKQKGRKGSRKTVLFVGLGCGTLVLGVFCIGGGVLLWLFVRMPPPEQVLVGRWILDLEATNKLYPEQQQQKIPKGKEGDFLTLDFKADGVLEGTRGNTTRREKWKVLSSQENTATVEITAENGRNTEQLVLTVRSRNQIHIVPREERTTFKGFVLKRVGGSQFP